MNTLISLINLFRRSGLVESLRAFSEQYCRKNPNWTAYQVHMGRDLSTDAAINCLARVRLEIRARQEIEQRFEVASCGQELSGLIQAERLLRRFLLDRRIKEIEYFAS